MKPSQKEKSIPSQENLQNTTGVIFVGKSILQPTYRWITYSQLSDPKDFFLGIRLFPDCSAQEKTYKSYVENATLSKPKKKEEIKIKSNIVFSSSSDNWSTPKFLYEQLNSEFLFTFDPCPLNSTFDGLSIDWIGSIFINPPYSNIKEFLKKGIEELTKENCTTLVYLIPSRTDTKWFHEFIYNKAEIRFIKGRLKFGDSKNSAPFPSMICIFKKEKYV